jgi:hypothetical protein
MPVIGTLREFITSHGPEYIVVSKEGFRTGGEEQKLCWSSGAVWADGAGYEPPTDPRALATLQLEYVKVKLEREVTDWQNYRKEVVDQCQLAAKYPNLPAPPPNAEQLLTAGAERIAALRARLKELTDFLEPEIKEPKISQVWAESMQEERAQELRGLASRLNRLDVG